MTDLVPTTVSDGVAVLTLDRPPLNLVTLELTRQLARRLAALAEDPAVRVLVVTGAGERAFCAGSDIGEFTGLMRPGAFVEEKMVHENAAWTALDDFPRPTIAAINGVAYGGGLELAVCCDLIVASADARLALPEIKLAVFPGSGGTVRVPRRIGEGRAKEMMFLGEPIDAQTALAWGLVNRVAPAGQALPAALALAARLAEGPGRALTICKRAIDLAADTSRDDAIRRAQFLTDEVIQTADAREGVRAFFARETPRFRHA